MYGCFSTYGCLPGKLEEMVPPSGSGDVNYYYTYTYNPTLAQWITNWSTTTQTSPTTSQVATYTTNSSGELINESVVNDVFGGASTPVSSASGDLLQRVRQQQRRRRRHRVHPKLRFVWQHQRDLLPLLRRWLQWRQRRRDDWCSGRYQPRPARRAPSSPSAARPCNA